MQPYAMHDEPGWKYGVTGIYRFTMSESCVIMHDNNKIITTWDNCGEHIYVIYSFISSPTTKFICYRHQGHTYNSSTATRSSQF